MSATTTTPQKQNITLPRNVLRRYRASGLALLRRKKPNELNPAMPKALGNSSAKHRPAYARSKSRAPPPKRKRTAIGQLRRRPPRTRVRRRRRPHHHPAKARRSRSTSTRPDPLPSLLHLRPPSNSSNLREWMTRPMTSPVGTDRAQLSSEKLTLTATGGRCARISREKETIVTRPARLLARRPPTGKSARKAAPQQRRRRRQHPDLGTPVVGGVVVLLLPRAPRAPVADGPPWPL